MQINVAKFLEEAGITEAFYPGKRFVHKCKLLGEYKNHSVVFDWRNPDKIRIEVKAGLSGKNLEPKVLRHYPVSFQSPTYVEVEIVNDNDTDDEEDAGTASGGKKGGGGKQPAKKPLDNVARIASAFGQMVESKIPELGKVVELVVMGKAIAESAYAQVLENFAEQIKHVRIATTDLLVKAGDMITKYEPPSFLEKKGDETATYKYDREKNADIGFKMTMV